MQKKKNSLVKQDSNKKYWIIGIILLLGIGIYFAINNIDFNKFNKDKQLNEEVNKEQQNNVSSMDIFGLNDYLGESMGNLITIIMGLSVFMILFGIIIPFIHPKKKENGGFTMKKEEKEEKNKDEFEDEEDNDEEDLEEDNEYEEDTI